MGISSPKQNIVNSQEVNGDYHRLYTPSNTPNNSPNLTPISINSRTQMVNNPPDSYREHIHEKSCCEKTCNCISKHFENNKCKYCTCLCTGCILCLILQ